MRPRRPPEGPGVGTAALAARVVVGGAPLALLLAPGAEGAWFPVVVGLACVGVPLALAVADLASAVPAEGGPYAWARVAFGPGWGFAAAWWRATASVLDAAVATTALAWFSTLHGGGASGGAVALATVAAVGLIVAAAPSSTWWLGIGGAVALPAVLALGEPVVGSLPDWAGIAGSGLVGAILSTRGGDLAGMAAAEAGRPRRTVARATAVGIGCLAAVVTLALAVDAAPFGAGARLAAGGWAALASVVAAWAFLAARVAVGVASAARLVGALAADRYLPASMAPGPDGKASQVAVGACAAIAAAGTFLPVSEAMAVLGGAWACAVSTQVVAMVVLRSSRARLVRGFAVPGGLPGASLCAAVPITAMLVAVATGLADGGARWAVIVGACVLSAPVAWVGLTVLVKRGRPNRPVVLELEPRRFDAAWPGTPVITGAPGNVMTRGA